MDVGGEQLAKRYVDQAVPLYGRQAVETGGSNPDVEVAAAVAGARVAGVQVALVFDLQDVRVQGRAQPVPDGSDPVYSRPGGHGMTWMKGLTVTSVQAPACT